MMIRSKITMLIRAVCYENYKVRLFFFVAVLCTVLSQTFDVLIKKCSHQSGYEKKIYKPAIVSKCKYKVKVQLRKHSFIAHNIITQHTLL